MNDEDAAVLQHLEKKCIDYLSTVSGHQATTEELQRQTGVVDMQSLAQVLNRMLSKTLMDVRTNARGELVYSLIKLEEKLKVEDLEKEETLVYRFIQQVGTQGIWVRTLANRTNLHQNILTKALKKLEQRQLVKTVKSVKLGNRKLYMLYDLEPSNEVTGGIWFSEQELDVDFVATIARTCLRYIQQHSFPSDPHSVYPPNYKGYPTLTGLTRYISESKVSNVALGPEDLQMVLNTLICDGLIETVYHDGDDDEEDRFRATRDPQPFHGLSKLAAKPTHHPTDLDGYLSAWLHYE